MILFAEEPRDPPSSERSVPYGQNTVMRSSDAFSVTCVASQQFKGLTPGPSALQALHGPSTAVRGRRPGLISACLKSAFCRSCRKPLFRACELPTTVFQMVW